MSAPWVPITAHTGPYLLIDKSCAILFDRETESQGVQLPKAARMTHIPPQVCLHIPKTRLRGDFTHKLGGGVTGSEPGMQLASGGGGGALERIEL